MSTARRVILFVAIALFLLEIGARIATGYGVPLLWLVIVALAAINYVLWRRDQAYWSGVDSTAAEQPE